jgi:hypothetical protein
MEYCTNASLLFCFLIVALFMIHAKSTSAYADQISNVIRQAEKCRDELRWLLQPSPVDGFVPLVSAVDHFHQQYQELETAVQTNKPSSSTMCTALKELPFFTIKGNQQAKKVKSGGWQNLVLYETVDPVLQMCDTIASNQHNQHKLLSDRAPEVFRSVLPEITVYVAHAQSDADLRSFTNELSVVHYELPDDLDTPNVFNVVVKDLSKGYPCVLLQENCAVLVLDRAHKQLLLVDSLAPLVTKAVWEFVDTDLRLKLTALDIANAAAKPGGPPITQTWIAMHLCTRVSQNLTQSIDQFCSVNPYKVTAAKVDTLKSAAANRFAAAWKLLIAFYVIEALDIARRGTTFSMLDIVSLLRNQDLSSGTGNTRFFGLVGYYFKVYKGDDITKTTWHDQMSTNTLLKDRARKFYELATACRTTVPFRALRQPTFFDVSALLITHDRATDGEKAATSPATSAAPAAPAAPPRRVCQTEFANQRIALAQRRAAWKPARGSKSVDIDDVSLFGGRHQERYSHHAFA